MSDGVGGERHFQGTKQGRAFWAEGSAFMKASQHVVAFLECQQVPEAGAGAYTQGRDEGWIAKGPPCST